MLFVKIVPLKELPAFLKRLTHFLKNNPCLYTLHLTLYTLHLTLYTLHQKNRPKRRFFFLRKYICAHAYLNYVARRMFIFGVGFALLFLNIRQCEGLRSWNGNSRNPRFFVCLPLSMSNFSFRGQGILRTSRYGEKLFMDLIADCKRTNKNQYVSCSSYRKAVPLQTRIK